MPVRPVRYGRCSEHGIVDLAGREYEVGIVDGQLSILGENTWTPGWYWVFCDDDKKKPGRDCGHFLSPTDDLTAFFLEHEFEITGGQRPSA